MDAYYSSLQTPQFRVLSDRQIERVYQATLECLNRTGVEVHNAEARELLAAAGAAVDGVRVRIPPHIVQDAIAATPRTFTIWGRDGQHRMQIVLDKVHYGPGPTCTYFMDPETGERRMTRRGDPGLTAKVCDALENIDYVMSLGLIDDVPRICAPVYEFAEMLANTGKPVGLGLCARQRAGHLPDRAGSRGERGRLAGAAVLWVLRDLPIAAGAHRGRPRQRAVGGRARHPGDLHRRRLRGHDGAHHRRGQPGDLPGRRVERAGDPAAQEARRGRLHRRRARGDGPQDGPARIRQPGDEPLQRGGADISRYLGLAFMGTSGASEAKTLDLQAAVESTVQTLLSGLSGATLVHDIGFLDCAQIGSLESLVMNDEIIGMTRRIMRGIEVSDDALMLDLIDQVGPGGEFMSQEVTAKRCRTEIWNPTLMDRQPWDVWEAAGSKTATDRIRAKLGKILARHTPPPLPEGAAEKIAAILREAEVRNTK